MVAPLTEVKAVPCSAKSFNMQLAGTHKFFSNDAIELMSLTLNRKTDARLGQKGKVFFLLPKAKTPFNGVSSVFMVRHLT